MNIEDRQQITIQIGSYSNYVGAHFWNCQDDIIRDLVLTSDDQDNQEELPMKYNLERMYKIRNSRVNKLSITPRALVIEHRGSLGSYNPTGEYEEQMDIPTWDGEKYVIKKAQEEKNSFIQMLEQEQNYFWNENQIEEQEKVQDQEEEEEIEEIRLDESQIKAWTDYLKVFDSTTLPFANCLFGRYHSRLTPIPQVSVPLDALILPGFAQDIITPDHREEYFDRIRKLIEDCDWLRNITILSDLFDGFGGLTCSLCEEIRDEIPRITMPIWAFTDDSSSRSEVTKLQQCNIPLCYSSLLSADIASVVIPMSTFSAPYVSPFVDIQSSFKYHTSAVFASAFEVATGFQRLTSTLSGHSTSDAFGYLTPESRVSVENISDGNWAAELTSNYQYRLCTLEANFPYPLNPCSQSCFAPLFDLYSSNSHREDVINPFMYSLSSATWGIYSGKKEFKKFNPSRPSESNIICTRGFQSSIFTSQMISNAQNHLSYYVSGMHQRSYGLPLPNSYPSIFRGVDSEGFVQISQNIPNSQNASILFPPRSKLLELDSIREIERQNGISRQHCDSLVALTGVGCNRNLLSSHLKTIYSLWRNKDNITTSELARLGISQGDSNEIDENLANLVSKYDEE